MKYCFLLMLGIVASSSMASSFGTNPTKSLLQKTYKPLAAEGIAFAIRGGSSPESETTTALNASDGTEDTFSTALNANSSDEVGEEPVEETKEVVTAVEKTGVRNFMGPKATPPGLLRRKLPGLPWHTLPDLLTYARCVAIPGLIVQYYCSTHPNKHLHSSLIFAIASITDFLDGFLARRWDICSPFGAFLDPVADKLMVSTALILLSGTYGSVVAVPSAIILAREIAVSALREWMASRGKRDSVKVGFQGKCKTAATMVALSIILAVPQGWFAVPFWGITKNIGMWMLYFSALVTVTSGSVYFKAAAPVLMGKE